jgi:hypothetical protein
MLFVGRVTKFRGTDQLDAALSVRRTLRAATKKTRPPVVVYDLDVIVCEMWDVLSDGD